MIRKFLAPVMENRPLDAPGHFVLTFHSPELAAIVRPGHFVVVAGDPNLQILRRPFSIYTADPETGLCTILFSLHGNTTKLMSTLQPGATLDLLGPLGRKLFKADERPGVHHVMIGGGYGVPPLNFLAREIMAKDPNARVTLINGARTANCLVGAEGLDERGVGITCTTDDGTFGIQGRVTAALEPLLEENDGPIHLYTCGPTPMMKAVAEAAIRHDIPCQASLEVFMPCGIGICMGCAVPRPDGTFARGCFEGPVFEAREVVW